jgi:tyrosyl-tRNA synthetase
MGKTAQGAIWLNADQCAPYDFWQYWRNCEDADVGRFLKLFTVLPLDEIARLEALRGAEVNEAKKVLATEATRLLHGTAEAERAAETARLAFEEGVAATTLPTVDIAASDIAAGLGALSAFVRAGLVASTGEARRQVKAGGLRLNDVVVTDERLVLDDAAFAQDGRAKLSFGRKKHVLLRRI